MIVASHRGPVSFRREADGSFSTRRGAGGVVSALGPLLRGRPDARWIAAAIGDDDRAAVAAGAKAVSDIDAQLLLLDADHHRLHYDEISNRVLWFLLHGLFDLPHQPNFDAELADAWSAFRAVNTAFAEAIAQTASPGEVVLVQDLHLILVPGILGGLRPDLRISHFTHTPFCGPNSIRVLPDAVAGELCSSLATTAVGFHSERWARAYRASIAEVLGASVEAEAEAFVATFGPDEADLASVAAGPAVAEAATALASRVGERHTIVRCDRIELSKNIVRGFLAYDVLLEQHPEWHDRVCFVAELNPSRESLAEYRAYRAEVEATTAGVNQRWGTSTWEPIVIDTQDDFPRSVAAMQRADVLMVNPVRDGLNLVAMEGPILGTRDPVLCLSRDAGAFDFLADGCLEINPYDILGTAAAMHRALTMEPDERRRRADGLRRESLARPADAWLDQLEAHARPAQRAQSGPVNSPNA